jgi:phosphate transport system substrate-binding protein
MSTVNSAEPMKRTSRRRLPLVGTAAFALLAAVLVQLWGITVAGADPPITSTGSSFAGVAIESWTSQASVLYGDDINFQISNSVTGMQFFAQGQVDVGASDIPYTTDQSPTDPSVPYQYLPDVAGGLALMYNLTNPNTGQRITNLNLNATAIAEIFLGQITNWDNPLIQQLNPTLGSMNVPIDAIYRSDGAGENYLLSDYLLHEANSTFVTAQQKFGLPGSGPSSVGSPSATWPTPVSVCGGGICTPSQLPGYPGWTTGSGLTGASGADISANDVAASNANGAITYVETAYAKEHALPVANLANQAGNFVQPSSDDVSTAMEDAVLYPDLTQNLAGVYTNSQPTAYPLSSYSYLITQCFPNLAAAEASEDSSAACDGAGTPNFASQKGAELGQFLDYMACGGQQSMASIGYSPIPYALVQEDFWAIGRIAGATQPPSPTASNCNNPCVTGQADCHNPIFLGGGPGGSGPGGGGPGSSTTVPGGKNGGSGGNGSGGNGSGSGGGGGNTNGASAAQVAAACKALASKNANLAAAACTANGTLKAGYSYVNGQIVKNLGGGALAQAARGTALLASVDRFLGPGVAQGLLWFLLALIVLGGPPLIAYYYKRTRSGGGKHSAGASTGG